MIAEPFIATKGPKIGEIHWIETLGFTTDIGYHNHEQFAGCHFKRFADFEREKLDVLGIIQIETCPMYSSPKRPTGNAFFCSTPKEDYGSVVVINYWNRDFIKDTESSRLLKRAEFLKAVCEKEGVEWLPKEKCGSQCKLIGKNYCSEHLALQPPTTEEREDHGCDKCNVNDGRIRVHCYPCTCACHKPTKERTGEAEHWTKSDKEIRAGLSQLYRTIRKALGFTCLPDLRCRCGNDLPCLECHRAYCGCKCQSLADASTSCYSKRPTQEGEAKRYDHPDGTHCPECPGDSCNKLDGCPCICHEAQRTNYYTKREVDERMDALIIFTEMKLMCTRGPTCEECKRIAQELRSRFLRPGA